MIRVLVVDDNAAELATMVRALESDPDIKIVATLSGGAEAVAALQISVPDIVVMDTVMPGMDGLEATRKIMASKPVPIILVTSRLDPYIVQLSFNALEAGAVSFLEKPGDSTVYGYIPLRNKLIQTVKAMSEVKVIRRWDRQKAPPPRQAPQSTPPVKLQPGNIDLVAVGASVGGPPVVHSIISRLPSNFPVPVLVVQHILQGFSDGMIRWFNENGRGPVAYLAKSGETARPGRVYFAPDGCHMKILPDKTIILTSDDPENGFRPSVSYMFRSVAKSFGDKAVGVLLTGMGRDGADGLRLMREKGALTIAQDEESCVVFGMPGEAVKIGAVMRVMQPENIPDALMNAVGITLDEKRLA